jgi:MFS family permease
VSIKPRPSTLADPDTEIDRSVGAAARAAGTAVANRAIESPRPFGDDGHDGRPSGGRAFASNMFDSLAHRGFRWFFLAMMGQMASMNMQMLVRGYLVYELTGSYADLGVVSLASAAPMILLSLHGGVLADKARSKKIVVMTGQFLSAMNALAIAMLIVFGALSYDALLVAAVVQGVIQALMMPSRQAMIPEVVGMRRLMNAVALNSAGMNSMRLLAPAVGGFLLAIFSPSWVYFVMTGGYLWATVFLVKVPTQPDPAFYEEHDGSAPGRRRSHGHGHGGDGGAQGGGLLEGLRYIAKEPTLRLILGVNILLILTSMPYVFLLPGFVASVLHEGPDKLGILLSLTGAGSLVGSLVIAGLPARHRGMLFLLTSLFQGLMLTVFSVSTWFWLTAPVMALMGIGQAGRQSFSNVLVQAYTDDEHRGRVMSVYMWQFGLTSLGTFVVGVLASLIGAQWALGGTSVAMVLLALAVLVGSPRMRQLA